MKNFLKRIIAFTPVAFQEELKRIHFRRQIKSGTFITWEPEFEDLYKFVGDGDWVIDVGANIGHYTNRLSELVGINGRVIAFEPMPITFSHLSRNTLYSKYQNVTLINTAVSDKTLSVGMSIPCFSTGLKNYYQASISSDKNGNDIPVLALSLDSLQLNKKISLIKIDAEGHEPAVFRGAWKLLERDKPILIVETVTENIQQRLENLGYCVKHNENSPNTVFQAM